MLELDVNGRTCIPHVGYLPWVSRDRRFALHQIIRDRPRGHISLRATMSPLLGAERCSGSRSPSLQVLKCQLRAVAIMSHLVWVYGPASTRAFTPFLGCLPARSDYKLLEDWVCARLTVSLTALVACRRVPDAGWIR